MFAKYNMAWRGIYFFLNKGAGKRNRFSFLQTWQFWSASDHYLLTLGKGMHRYFLQAMMMKMMKWTSWPHEVNPSLSDLHSNAGHKYISQVVLGLCPDDRIHVLLCKRGNPINLITSQPLLGFYILKPIYL